MRELSRDDDTGAVKLRLTPVHADRLYAEIGAPATSASAEVEGGIYETNELRVSFLAVDSKGEHETGPPFEWSNRITLKSREYLSTATNAYSRSSPPRAPRSSTPRTVPIRALGGGAYDGPFTLPEGTRIVLAVGENDGITSEQHKREIAAKAQPKPIDPSAEAVWRPSSPGFAFETTQNAYGFITASRTTTALPGD